MEQKKKLDNEKKMRKAARFAFRAPRENFTISDFEFDKLYGIGSYSKVVRAKKRDTGVVCALKIMNKPFIIKQNRAACAKLERLVLDQLDHPGVVRLLFTFRDTSSLYMALEACEGGELFDQIARKGHLSEDEARFYTAEIVDALEYIHEMGLVHRDIKPENLLITADGHIKIADFGCIKTMEDTRLRVLPAAELDVINASKFVGTAAYMSPEVLSFDSASFGNDLWALGCTLYQMLAGATPFKDASEWHMFQRILTRDFRIPNHLSEEAKDLIDRLLDMDPIRRLGTGPNGYATLKKQPFFKGVNWTNLRSHTPPTIATEPSIEESDDDEDIDDSSWDASHVRWFSAAQSVASDKSASSSGAPNNCHVPFASSDSYDWQQFLEPGEAILLSSTVEKVQKLSKKKVQLILTDKPRLICTSPSKCKQEGDIIWSDTTNDLSVQVTSPSHFKICTLKRVISFEDAQQRANRWKRALEELQNQ